MYELEEAYNIITVGLPRGKRVVIDSPSSLNRAIPHIAKTLKTSPREVATILSKAIHSSPDIDRDIVTTINGLEAHLSNVNS